MPQTVDLTSPIDGSVCPTRQTLSCEPAVDIADHAHHVQGRRANRSLERRVEPVFKASEIVGPTDAGTAIEAAHQTCTPCVAATSSFGTQHS